MRHLAPCGYFAERLLERGTGGAGVEKPARLARQYAVDYGRSGRSGGGSSSDSAHCRAGCAEAAMRSSAHTAEKCACCCEGGGEGSGYEKGGMWQGGEKLRQTVGGEGGRLRDSLLRQRAVWHERMRLPARKEEVCGGGGSSSSSSSTATRGQKKMIPRFVWNQLLRAGSTDTQRFPFCPY